MGEGEMGFEANGTVNTSESDQVLRMNAEPYLVRPRDLMLPSGLDYDKVAELLEALESDLPDDVSDSISGS